MFHSVTDLQKRVAVMAEFKPLAGSKVGELTQTPVSCRCHKQGDKKLAGAFGAARVQACSP